jgi:hypothetical protein
MTNQFILLSAEQAAQVRYTDPGKSGLRPIERTDGQFFLGLECLSDPRHGAYLATLPTYDGADGAKWRESAQALTATKTVKR